jgi:tryptophanyl-tRNA synthetase
MRAEARKTLEAAEKAMGLSAVWNRISRKAEDARKKRGDSPAAAQKGGG